MKTMKLTKIIANLLLASSLITLMPLEAQAETVSKQSGKVIENTKSDKKGEWISVKNSYTYNRWYRIGDSWATGWQLIDGKWYYFYVSGDMMTNCTKDGYRAGEDGVCVPV